MTQDDVSDRLGLTGECKRRTMTRYEKGGRNPKEERTKEIAEILNVDVNAIKKYDYKNQIDLIYLFLWLEEYIPNYRLNLSQIIKLIEGTMCDEDRLISAYIYETRWRSIPNTLELEKIFLK